MSIIYDALKRIEQNVTNSHNQKGIPADKKEPRVQKSNPLLVFILIILSAVFIIKTVMHIMKRPKATPPAVSLESLTTESKPSSIDQTLEEEVAIQEPVEPVLTLNGIYFQGKEGYALINNRIVKSGDTIQKAIVKEISLERVSLDFEGKVITLVNTSR